MIRNTSKKSVLAQRVKTCTTMLAKARGLMFRKPISDEGYVFIFGKEAKWELHMLFVFFPIDVLYIDRSRTVVDFKKKLMPFTYYIPRKAASYVIELPEGTISASKTAIGDKIEW